MKKILKKVLQKKKKYSRLQIHVTSTLKGDTMKKILALSLLLSSAAFAGHEEGSRWGLGLRAGVGAFAGKLNQVLTINAGDYGTAAAPVVPTTVYPVSIQTLCNNNGYTSFQGGAFLEFGYRSCDWSFGALIDVNGDTLKKTYLNIQQQPYDITQTLGTGATTVNASTISSSTVGTKFNLQSSTIKAPIHVGGDIRGGMYFGDALWYVLVGGEGIQIKHSSYASVNYLLDALNPTLTSPAGGATGNVAVTGMTPLANPLIIGIPYYSNDCNTSCNTVCSTTVASNCNTSCNTNYNNCNTNYNNCNSSWRGALRVGTGIEYNWSDCFNVKLEYRFLWAGKKCYTLSSVYDSTKPASFQVLNVTTAIPSTANTAVANLSNALASGNIVDTLYFRQHVTALMFSYQF
jgi:opacity protein-like surface antigen